jgi:hypothetical protein
MHSLGSLAQFACLPACLIPAHTYNAVQRSAVQCSAEAGHHPRSSLTLRYFGKSNIRHGGRLVERQLHRKRKQHSND